MISIQRVYAITLKLFRSATHPAKIFEDIYWPLMDILLMGMTGVWMQSSQSNAKPYALAMLVGAVLWQLSTRAYFAISVNILEELWARNFVNLFATPLKLTEWIIAGIILSTVRAFFVLCIGGLLVWIFYAKNIFALGFALVPLYGLMLMFGVTLGFLSSSMLFVYGQKMQAIIWALSWFFAPFCGVFYPMEVLPGWMQVIGYAMPATYALESMRSLVFNGYLSYKMLATGLCLNIVYLMIALACFVYTFERSRSNGLSRLE